MNSSPEKISWALSKYQFSRRESPKLKPSVSESHSKQRSTLSSRLSVVARINSQDQHKRKAAQLEGADKNSGETEMVRAHLTIDDLDEPQIKEVAGEKRKRLACSKTSTTAGGAGTCTSTVTQSQGPVCNFEECVHQASEIFRTNDDTISIDMKKSRSETKNEDTHKGECYRADTNVGQKTAKSVHVEKADSISEEEEESIEDEELFRNSLGKEFKLNMSDEAKELLRELALAAKTQKPPTAARLKVFTNDTLEAVLRYNDRPVYKNMTNAELAVMVLDYMKHGCPPRCPKCKRGALRFSNGKKKYGKRYYWCPGYTTNGRNFYGCGFKADRKDIIRTPWQCP